MLKMRRGSAACAQTQQGATARTSEVADCGPDGVRLCAQHVGNLSVVVLGLLRWLELRRQDETLSSLHRRDIGLAGRWLLADHAVQLGRYMHTRDLLLRHRHRQICGRVSTARRARPPRRSPSSPPCSAWRSSNTGSWCCRCLSKRCGAGVCDHARRAPPTGSAPRPETPVFTHGAPRRGA